MQYSLGVSGAPPCQLGLIPNDSRTAKVSKGFFVTRLSHLDKIAMYVGSSSQMLEDDLPTLRAGLSYGIHLRENPSMKFKKTKI